MYLHNIRKHENECSQYKHTRIKRDAEKEDVPLKGNPLCLHEKECSI